MTSVNSFSVRLSANLKRRNWVLALSVLFSIFVTLGTLAAYYTRINAYNERGIYAGSSEYYLAMRQATSDALVFSGYISVFAVISAIVIAIQGFSYLYSKSKLDFYMSHPVSASRRFAVINTGSLLIYAVPLLISLVLSVLYAASQNAISTAVLSRICVSFLNYLLVFAAAYCSTLLAIMLTGNLLMTVLGTGIFLGYEGLYVLTKESLDSLFLDSLDYSFRAPHQYISALALQADIWELGLSDTNIALWSQKLIVSLILTLVNILFFGILSYYAYMHRDGEAAGKSIVYAKTRIWIKLPVAVIFSLLFSAAVYGMTMDNAGFTTTFLIICSLLMGAIIQILFDMNIASALKALPSTVAVCIIALIIYGGYYFDITGYDRYVPSADKLESCAIAFNNDIYESDWYMFNRDSWNIEERYDFLKEHMYFDDTDTIISLVEHSIPAQNISNDNDERYATYSILFRLNSNRIVTRSYAINLNNSDNNEVLNRLFSNDTYYIAVNPALNNLGETNKESIKDISFECVTGSFPVLCTYDELISAIKKDMEAYYSYDLMRNSNKVGKITISYPSHCKTYINIYPEYTNTLALLTSLAVEYDNNIEPEDVSHISITYYGNKSNSNSAIEDNYDIYIDHTTDFYSPEEIATILDSIVLTDTFTSWSDTRGTRTDYSIEIALKKATKSFDYYSDRSNSVYALFYEDSVPNFINAESE